MSSVVERLRMSTAGRRIATPLLFNAAMAIALRLALPYTLAEGGERYQYYAMARAHGFPQNCPSFHCFRALPALLAGLWPIETADAFLLTGVLFETLAGAALWCLAERFDGRREVACFATLWFWVTWGPIQSFTDPLLIADPIQAFWSIASLSLLIAGRFVAVLPLLVSGAAVKEAVLLVPVVYVLYVVLANDPARKKPIWLAAIVIVPVSAWILFRIYLAARFSYRGGAIASQVQQLPVITEWFTSLAPWPSNLVVAALHIYGAFGAAWLAAVFGLRIATWRQRALTLASLPAMLFLSILQSPDRALASFPYGVLIPAAIFVAQLPRWLAAALLAGNLAFTIEMNIAHGAGARVGARVFFLLVLSAATVAAVRIRPRQREVDSAPPSARTGSFHRFESAFAVAGLCALLVLLVALVGRAIGSTPTTVEIDLSRASGVRPVDDGTGAPGVAASSDGRRVVFVGATSSGARRLFVYEIASSEVTEVADTDDAAGPFLAPDGTRVGFFAHGRLVTADLDAHRSSVLADAPSGRGGTWNARGTIVFAPSLSGGLAQVPEHGGSVNPVTTVDTRPAPASHRWPSFLPDGDHFLFVARGGGADSEGVYVGSLRSPGFERLTTHATTTAAYVTSGLLVTSWQDHLVAYSFDAKRRQLFSRAMPVADHVLLAPGTGRTAFAASRNTLVYAPPVVNESDADAGIQSQLVRVDRSGRILGTLGSIGNADDVQISSDQRWIAETVRSANGHISEVRRQPRELTGWSTFVSMPDRSQLTPVWSPDGSRIAFAIQPVLYHTWYLVEQAATGAAPERRLASHPDRPTRPTTWSPDGRLLLYQTWTNERWGVWSVSPNDGGEPSPVVRDTFNAVQAQLSPDGMWLAYSSDESGRREIYVEPFPRSGAKWRLSVEGGSQPRWRADGREIVYVARDALVTAVPIETTPAFRIGAPHLLFELPLAPDRRCAFCYQFAMTPDAQQFIVNRRATAPPPAPLVVLTNWQRAVPPA